MCAATGQRKTVPEVAMPFRNGHLQSGRHGLPASPEFSVPAVALLSRLRVQSSLRTVTEAPASLWSRELPDTTGRSCTVETSSLCTHMPSSIAQTLRDRYVVLTPRLSGISQISR